MIDRNIFTDVRRADWHDLDVAAAVVVGRALAALALAYFDVLFF